MTKFVGDRLTNLALQDGLSYSTANQRKYHLQQLKMQFIFFKQKYNF